MTLGEYLKQKRTEKGYTYKQLARLVEASPQFLCDLEKDRRSVGMFLLLKLAFVLMLDDDYMYYLQGRIPPDIWEMNLSEKEVKVLFTKLRAKK